MRISNQMLNQTLAGNISENQAAVYEQTQQISLGKRIQRASDDPASWSRASQLQGSQDRLAQYERNSTLLEAQLMSIDHSLGSIGDLLQSASEIAVEGSDPTLNDAARAALGEQLDLLLESLVNSANCSYNGQYQFGGTQTDIPPFSATLGADGRIESVQYNGSSSAAQIGITDGDSLPSQLVGGDASNGVLLSDAGDPFATLVEMRQRLFNGENLAESGLQDQIDTAFERVIVGRASVGAYLEHISFVAEVRTSQTGQLKEDLADTQDIDLAQAATSLSEKQSAYEAALAIATQTMRTSLIDYL